MIKKLLSFFLLLFLSFAVHAQDSLWTILQSQKPADDDKVIATFKSTKIISAQSNETMKKRNLDFRVAHLFGNMGNESGGGVHTLYGLDQSNDIRIAFDYGITDRLMLSVGRNKRQENLSGAVKIRTLEQTTDDRVPVAITLYANTAYTTKTDVNEGDTVTTISGTRRMSYCLQAIFARKFSSKFSFEVIGSLIHRNLVDLRINPQDKNDLASVGVGGRFKFTKSMAIIADYFYSFRDKSTGIKMYNPLSAGIEIETGGHVFSIMFTNAVGLLENDFIPNTSDSWSNGGYKFSFNISRVFKL
jgi:predicted porin